MGYVFASFNSPEEILGRPMIPVIESLRIGEPIKSGIDFNGIKLVSIEFEPSRFRNVRGIEDILPMIIDISGGSHFPLGRVVFENLMVL